MRSFEDRMAEIERRSGEILAKRKRRRKQLLVLCIPLVLCMGLLLWLLPPGAVMEKGNDWLGMENVQEDALSNGVAPGDPGLTGAAGSVAATRIQVTRAEVVSMCMDPARTEPLAALLEELTETQYRTDQSLESSKDETLCPDDAGTQENTQSADVRITLFGSDGSRVEFILMGSVLYRDNHAYDLTQAQLEQLLELLEGM